MTEQRALVAFVWVYCQRTAVAVGDSAVPRVPPITLGDGTGKDTAGTGALLGSVGRGMAPRALEDPITLMGCRRCPGVATGPIAPHGVQGSLQGAAGLHGVQGGSTGAQQPH